MIHRNKQILFFDCKKLFVLCQMFAQIIWGVFKQIACKQFLLQNIVHVKTKQRQGILYVSTGFPFNFPNKDMLIILNLKLIK